MWARIRPSLNIDKECGERQNVNDEYLSAVRTKSYTDFFLKFQFMVKIESPPPPPPESFLDPGEETIESILNSSPAVNSSGQKSVLTSFFHAGADAARFCSQLLKNLSQVQSDHTILLRVIDGCDSPSSADRFSAAVAELRYCAVLDSPFSDGSRAEFDEFRCRNAAVLHRLKSKRKQISRKIKLIKSVNKASGVCAAAACGLAAAAAAFVAVHTCTAVLMWPALLSLPIKPLKKKIQNLAPITRRGSLRRAAVQLDAAAKGAYILNRDFDLMSRLVARLQDEIDHNKALIRLCLERMDGARRRFPAQVVAELKKYELGFRRHVQELEEHVYLCLVTINRARALVLNEIH
ncbi:UPF0496 protein At3g49070-like [Andrographis paniculata]|uniref:UPF0496 protein At3g49070-like n=1 Tax=Andrographis paniculata TaxID=175694 RepID=UPI0021E78995|nr:UPF0496 protein At3g49070-like [Andrographis paniculata]